jgi:excinuclease ABC subunit C
MKDRRGNVVYVGKAKDLNNRVRSYFQPAGDQRTFVEALPHVLGDIDVIITESEKEAMILENTLIKQHQPRFNVKLKDDKNFLSLRIDNDAEWPRVQVVRRQKKDRARYFGPYHTAKSIRRTLNVLNRHFQLRTCPDNVLNNRTRPCLQYQIKRCPGPCVFDIDRDEYMGHVEDAILFLEGRGDELVEGLRDKMMDASDALEFELAAHYRDQIASIEKALQRQHAVSTDWVDRDVFGMYREGDRATMQVMFVRSGKLEGARSFSYEDQEFPDQEVLSSFLNLYYAAGNFIPKEILLPFELDEGEAEAYEELLGEKKHERVYVKVPKRGSKKALIDTAMANAKQSFEDEYSQEERNKDMLDKLGGRLKLRQYPQRIECFDISNFQGKQIVGSMVVFEDGEPNKQEYRRYKMKDVSAQDDFASMREILMRRFKKVAEDEGPRPDLVVIDGGRGQLAQAVTVLEDLGIHDVDVVALAKARVDRVGFDDPEVTKSRERVFLPGRKNPVMLNPNSAELFLLERLRDEAHRFAITYHQELRRKQTLRSVLEDIPGVGKKTKKDLLRHFGSLSKIRKASPEQLREVPGVGPQTADAIAEFFRAVSS